MASKGRILIVEDHGDFADLLARAVSAAGFTPVLAGGVPAALSMLAELPPDAVVLDLHLPGGSAESILHAVRACPNPAPPVVVLTAADLSIAERERLLALGASATLRKPYGLPEFVALLDSLVLARSGAPVAVRRPRRTLDRLDIRWSATAGSAAGAALLALAGAPAWSAAALSALSVVGIASLLVRTSRAEEILGAHRARLEEEVENRTRSLTATNRSLEEAHRRLQQAGVRLATVERAATLGLVTAGVAHEINNPLAALASDHRALLRIVPSVIDPARRADAERVLARDGAAIERISRIVDDLGRVCRPQDAAREPKRVLVAQEVETALDLVSHKAHGGPEVIRNTRSVPTVLARPGEISQVVMNLAANAIEAAGPSGRVVIRTLAETRPDGTLWTRIEVTDDGPGVAEAVADRLFEPFVTTKAPGEGMGLGLAISSGIVRRLDGEIFVAETGPGGTTFVVRLPSMPAPPRDEAPAEAPLRRAVGEPT